MVLKLKRVVAAFIIACMFMQLLPMGTVLAYAAASERLQIENGFLSASINTKNGRFAIKTTGGFPGKNSDDNKQLLYENKVPETSFTSFKIGSKELIYGNTYYSTGSVLRTHFEPPKQEGNKLVSYWSYKEQAEGIDITVKQIIELVDKSGNNMEGNAKVTYEISNNASREISIGSRILFDVTAGDNDAPILLKAGDAFPIKGERLFTGNSVPLYWQAVDNWENPSISAYGLLYGWGM